MGNWRRWYWETFDYGNSCVMKREGSTFSVKYRRLNSRSVQKQKGLTIIIQYNDGLFSKILEGKNNLNGIREISLKRTSFLQLLCVEISA